MLEVPAWKIATPVDTFEHPETGSQIDIVSMLHIGEPEYYRRVGAHVMGRQAEGFQVHYEEIAAVDQGGSAQGVKERVKSKILDSAENAQVDAAVLLMLHLGYEVQPNEGLFLVDGSHRHDVTVNDVVESTSFALSVAKLVLERRRLMQYKKKLKSGREELDRHVFTGLRGETDGLKAGTQKRAPGDGFLVDRRNEVALRGVDVELAQDPSVGICLVWGWGHLRGLSAGLIDRGYVNVDHKEIEAITSDVVRGDELARHRANATKLQVKADRARKKLHRAEARLRR